MEMYETVSRMVEQIIKSVQNTGIFIVQALHRETDNVKEVLNTNTFPVKVTNPQTKVEVKGTVVVGNQAKLEKEVRDVSTQLKEVKKILPGLSRVTIMNHLKPQEFPTQFKITNLSDKTTVTNLNVVVNAVNELQKTVAKLKLDPQINVPAPTIPAPIVNIPKQVAPVVNVTEKEIDMSAVTELLSFWQSMTGSAKKALSVRLTDGKEFYKAMERLGEIMTANTPSSFQHSTGEGARAIVNRNNELQVTTNDTWDFNDSVSPSQNTTYFGEESVDGKWRVRCVTKTSTTTSIRHATIRNNPTYDNYVDAWDNRLTLTYGYAKEAL